MLLLSNLAIVGTVLGLVAAAPGPVVKRDSSCKPDYNIVPWDPKYNTGILPPCIESALGSQHLEGSLGGCFTDCALIVVRELPCIAKYIITMNINSLTQCGVTKSEVCDCASCLPDAAFKKIQPWCDSSLGDGVATTYDSSDSIYIDTADNNYKAFLGLLKVTEYQALKATADASPPTSPNPDDGLLGCVVGGSCGSCCCIGLCIVGTCTGICV